MHVTAHDPHAADAFAGSGVDRREFTALLAEADVVSLHVPLTPDTQGMVGADALAQMKPGAVLINAARGGVVNEPALAAALRSGRLGGAAIDVFAREPLDAEGAAVFADTPNLVLTPHIAGVTEKSNTRVSRGGG